MQPGQAIRLDRWLWQARLSKTRGLAASLVSDGSVRVNAVRVLKPATPLRVGDGVTFAQGDTIRVLRVRALGARRGPGPEARALYDDLAAPPSGQPLEPPSGTDT